VAALVERADVVVVTGTPFGASNLGNLLAATSSTRPIVLVKAAEDRDFTGGEATRALELARARGARTVTEEDVLDALERLVER
jgi:hypothetical protein